jgi:hypothetical protein
MTLQTEKTNLADAEQTGVSGSVRCVTTVAAFGLYGYVFIDKRAFFVNVALHANNISARDRSHLPKSCSAMDVVAVTALN